MIASRIVDSSKGRRDKVESFKSPYMLFVNQRFFPVDLTCTPKPRIAAALADLGRRCSTTAKKHKIL